jgi:diguanylate cyclase (GGDEF)-like protein
MADLDHFKLVNDTYGHMVGDAVLSAAADKMLSLFRSYDAIGRYGGEEFVIILPGCDGKSIAGIAERLRKTIGDELMDTPAGMIAVTMSLGVAISSKEKRQDVKSHVHAADQALYRAKTNGRNRVEFASVDE